MASVGGQGTTGTVERSSPMLGEGKIREGLNYD